MNEYHSEDRRPPIPDPTVLTTEAMARAVSSERDYVDGQIKVLREQLRGMDKATELLDRTVNRVPSDITKEVAHLKEVIAGDLVSIALQFKERDERAERESKDSKVALDAALAAQKEAASEQNKANTKAIDKSEAGAAETVRQLTRTFETKHDALAERVDDLKSQVNGAFNRGQGAGEQRVEARSNITIWIAAIGVIIAMALLLVGYEASRNHTTVVPEKSTVTVTVPS